MDSRVSKKIKSWLYKEKFTFLLCSLFFYTIAVPFFDKLPQNRLYAQLFFLIVLVSSVFAVSAKKRDLILVLILTCISILILCLNQFVENKNILMVDIISKVIFNGCLIYIILGHFYQSKWISRNTISAALITYVLLTLLWANLYFLIELMYPDSFTIPHEAIMADPPILRYFSFVTITTLGYGDIAPVSSQARMIAVVEAFVGQMYVAILIARLVAIHTSQPSEK